MPGKSPAEPVIVDVLHLCKMRCKGNFNSLIYSWGSQKKERNANATHHFALGQGIPTNKSLSKGINNFIKLPDRLAHLALHHFVCAGWCKSDLPLNKLPTFSDLIPWEQCYLKLFMRHHLRMFVQARTLKLKEITQAKSIQRLIIE